MRETFLDLAQMSTNQVDSQSFCRDCRQQLGWYLRDDSNEERPVDKDVKMLWLYSTQANCVCHMAWLGQAVQPKAASSSWLVHSAWPLICGSKLEDRLSLMLRMEQNSCQT